MTYGAEPARADALAHTMYIRPSRELVARSWHWPESWHEAYEQATTQLAHEVATCVLNGLSLVQHPITAELPAGRIGFCVTRWGTSIYIAVSEFEGPDEPEPNVPGPNGGTRRPNSANSLVLGLRGTGKNFTIVIFCGYLPPAPTGYYLACGARGRNFVYKWSKPPLSHLKSQYLQ